MECINRNYAKGGPFQSQFYPINLTQINDIKLCYDAECGKSLIDRKDLTDVK